MKIFWRCDDNKRPGMRVAGYLSAGHLGFSRYQVRATNCSNNLNERVERNEPPEKVIMKTKRHKCLVFKAERKPQFSWQIFVPCFHSIEIIISKFLICVLSMKKCIVLILCFFFLSWRAL